MAKVIEFYIPKNFRKPLRAVAQPQLGKIIGFCPHCEPASQTIPAWNRAIPRQLWNRFPRATQIGAISQQ